MSALPNLLMSGGLAVALLGWAWGERLPAPETLDARVTEMPVQDTVPAPPFQTVVDGIRYTVRPLATYDIAGLVVSRHDSDAWWDFIHKAWQDRLNVADLCVVYGANARSGAYRALSFSSGQFTCEVRADTHAAWQAFVPEALSNNHLLTDRPQLARLLRGVRPGDQVRLRGQLVEYAHDGGFRRGTSLVRDDTGNGACETLWVQDAAVIARGGGPWRLAPWAGAAAVLAGLVLWLRQPMRVRD